jgi:hypothetical protein
MPGDFDRAEEHTGEAGWPGPAAPWFRCEIARPDGTRVEFLELDPEGRACAARRAGPGEPGPGVPRRVAGPYSSGTAAEVIGAAAGVPAGDPWVSAVCRALQRDRELPGGPRDRRTTLEVTPGQGELFHVTAAANRESIARHGLDWRQMGAAPGIAGSLEPERAAVFVCRTREEADFFVPMGTSGSDVWAIRADGLWVENGPRGWLIISEPVPAGRLRLAGRDMPRHEPQDQVRPDGLAAAYQSKLTIRRADGTVIPWRPGAGGGKDSSPG